MAPRSITNTANRSNSSAISPTTSPATLRRASPISRCCGRCRRLKSPDHREQQWCGHCPKCRFVFLALAPFVAKDRLIAVFGRNLLDDEAQLAGFAELCGVRAHKPFECVGETGESAVAMAWLATRAEWRDDLVVRRLGEHLPVTAASDPAASLHSLLEKRHPHRVPARFLAMLDACGRPCQGPGRDLGARA